MNTMALYNRVCLKASRNTTFSYSTSFSLGIRSLDKRFHDPIHAIYGFVRFADEIVDTFHGHPKAELLQRFWDDTHRAVAEGLSLNPILHSFQGVVAQYRIEAEWPWTLLIRSTTNRAMPRTFWEVLKWWASCAYAFSAKGMRYGMIG